MFVVLLALGVTMLRRDTVQEFPGIEHGQALDDFGAYRGQARTAAVSQPPAARVGESSQSDDAPAGSVGRVQALERLAALRDRGAITDNEYQAEKTHVMNNGT